jgi:flagellar basal-body rod protein FlgB
MSLITDSTQRILEQALDGLSQRESLIASNLANINTPGFRPSSIDFETALRKELASAGLGSLGASATPAEALLPPSVGPSADAGLLTVGAGQSGTTGIGAGVAVAPQQFDGSTRNDGNSVDLESEMAALVQTQLRFGAVSKLVSGKLAMLRNAAGGHA